jgi:hypothetical protein
MSNTTIDLTPRLPGVTRTRGERAFGQKIGQKRVTAKEVLLVAVAVMFGLGFLMGPGWFVLSFFAAIWAFILSQDSARFVHPCPIFLNKVSSDSDATHRLLNDGLMDHLLDHKMTETLHEQYLRGVGGGYSHFTSLYEECTHHDPFAHCSPSHADGNCDSFVHR